MSGSRHRLGIVVGRCNAPGIFQSGRLPKIQPTSDNQNHRKECDKPFHAALLIEDAAADQEKICDGLMASRHPAASAGARLHLDKSFALDKKMRDFAKSDPDLAALRSSTKRAGQPSLFFSTPALFPASERRLKWSWPIRRPSVWVMVTSYSSMRTCSPCLGR